MGLWRGGAFWWAVGPGKDSESTPTPNQVQTLGVYSALIPDDASIFILMKTDRPPAVECASESAFPTGLFDREGEGLPDRCA